MQHRKGRRPHGEFSTAYLRALRTQRRAVEAGEEPPEWTKVFLAKGERCLSKEKLQALKKEA
jgi:hypothetical protein